MTLRPAFRQTARLEYDQAADYYEAQRRGLGERFVSAVDAAIERACEAPGRFPLQLRDIRRVRITGFPYAVYFRVRSEHLVVLGVLHLRRDPQVWCKRV